MSSRRNSRSIPSIFASRRLWRSSPVNSARQVGADDVARPAPARSRARRGRGRCSRRARPTGAPCRCRGRRRRGCSGTCTPRRPRRRPSRRPAPRGRRRRCAPPRRPAAPCPGSRPGRSTRCRGRSPRAPRAATVSSDHRLQREPRVVERAGDLHVRASPEIAPCRFWPVLVGVLLGGDQRRAEHARARPVAGDPDRRCSGPARARRGGSAASRAGSSSSSPARETPPPITTSSGSNVLIALAIPIPSRSPSTRRHYSDGVVARLGAVDDVVAVDRRPSARSILPEVGVRVLDRGVRRRAGPARARRPASPASRAAGTGRPARGRRRRGRAR